ncbi:MAG: formylmethanofuran dehydrogenase [Candidatus Lokiarchaeota archaeon]|nr:formylmethanofuran dehydrogenase [Candidatus Lokiarchaeota archaeon]MBD3341314.1 formylmethanofuran dehydrogenase [Candidatus Lokiarchaeota archaeon]
MKKAVEFHGHTCPGVTIGVLVAKYILEHGNDFSVDEELVSVVENDNCSVDALQALLGTTFGKGNLIFKDYGKNNYTFYNRTKEKAVKLSLKSENFGNRELSQEKRIKKLLNSKPKDIFNIERVEFDPPQKAQIYDSIICDHCGDPTMNTRIKNLQGKNLCIPCYRKVKSNN